MHFPILGRSVSRIEEKKILKKKKINITRHLGIGGPGNPSQVNIHIFGLKQFSCFCSYFFYAVTMLIFQIYLKELFQVENGLTTSLLFDFFGSVGRR